ncbi:MAG: flagellar hook-length control protein FliK [Butyribacter sp.]|nr:flagellar hook-length control protein FliK [bacterium]MDY3855263.1 flagellar hook-length control protein FliK [Butyribacter sp.]
MAGVEAVNFAKISSQAANPVKNVVSVSNNTNSFESFLQDSKPAASKQSTVKADTVTANAGNRPENETVYSVQDDTKTVSENVTGKEQSYDFEKLEETASALKEGIRDILKENLDISDEEIDNLLEMMGITITDLLNPQILQQFVLQLHGGQENMDFLMNEELLSDFSNLLQDMESLMTDDVQSLLMMMEQMEEPVTLDEFLAQAGNADSASAQENVTGFTMEADSQSETVATANNTANESVVPANDQMENMVEKITVHTDKEQNDAGTGEQNTFSEETASQDASQFLFSENEQQEAGTVQAFQDVFHMTPNDATQNFTANISGNQRMQQMVDIVNQVSNSIRSSLNADTTTMEVQLNPESLGKVFVSLVSKEGILTATFHVQTDEAKNALESQIYTLRENLEAKNLKVESVDVQISNFDFSQSDEAKQQKQSESAAKNKKQFKYDAELSEETEVSEEESATNLRRQIMRDTGGSIDFTA